MRTLLLWLLMLALPIYGASGTSLRLLGPAHWHAAPAVQAPASGDWLQPALKFAQRVVLRMQAEREQAHMRAHARGLQHAHAGLQHHWHDARDGSVQKLAGADPATADLVAGATFGSATLTLAAFALPFFIPATTANGRWQPAPDVAWADADPRRTSPPPRG